MLGGWLPAASGRQCRCMYTRSRTHSTCSAPPLAQPLSPVALADHHILYVPHLQRRRRRQQQHKQQKQRVSACSALPPQHLPGLITGQPRRCAGALLARPCWMQHHPRTFPQLWMNLRSTSSVAVPAIDLLSSSAAASGQEGALHQRRRRTEAGVAIASAGGGRQASVLPPLPLARTCCHRDVVVWVAVQLQEALCAHMQGGTQALTRCADCAADSSTTPHNSATGPP